MSASASVAGSSRATYTVNLPVGSTVTFTTNGILDPAASGTLSNTASVTSTGSVDLDPSDTTGSRHGASTPASQTVSPPTRVSRLTVPGTAGGGMVKMSWESTARSAR